MATQQMTTNFVASDSTCVLSHDVACGCLFCSDSLKAEIQVCFHLLLFSSANLPSSSNLLAGFLVHCGGTEVPVAQPTVTQELLGDS